MLLDNIEKNAAALRQAGPDAVNRARRMGVAAYYQDASAGPGIIKEHPDGSRERIRLDGDTEVHLGQVPSTP